MNLPKFATGASLLIPLILVCVQSSPKSFGESPIVFSAKETNDLYRVASQTFGDRVVRYASPREAIEATKPDGVLLVLADDYPQKSTKLSVDDLKELQQNNVRCYLEYPELLSGDGPFSPVASNVERVVVVDELFGKSLPPMSLMQVNGLRYVRVAPQIQESLGQPVVVAARVAGFDTAVFGLPKATSPLLFASDSGDAFVATTALSRFRQGRYSPYSSWRHLWNTLFTKLLSEKEPVSLQFAEPVVAATYGIDAKLSEESRRKAVVRGIDWFRKANMVIHPEWKDRVSGASGRVPPLPFGLPQGDGSLGSMEAVVSVIQADGHQDISSVQRGDCICETAAAFAAASKLLEKPEYANISKNLLDYWLLKSNATKRERGDPKHGAYGLIAWGITNPAWYCANYGDDNARVILASMTAAGLLGEEQWNEPIARCVVANLRTTGKLGFRGDRIDIGQLAGGWERYFKGAPVSYAPHFEGYLWACYLWAYSQTKDELLLERARTAIEMTMKQYPHGLRWTNGLAQERARILLPVAWLVRVDDTPEHRAMLKQAIDGLLSIQAECGAIREELGPPGRGMFPPPGSNAAYGHSEASLIARNGDQVADMLYTNNFALIGLREAAALTDDPRVIEAENKLAKFLIRIQANSEQVPEVDGGWMRAFDFKRWEPWGSNADLGWGAWSIESGWTQGWITTVLALRQMDTCMWDVMSNAKIAKQYSPIREAMLPQGFVDEVSPPKD